MVEYVQMFPSSEEKRTIGYRYDVLVQGYFQRFT
jgi:hypothetical protein